MMDGILDVELVPQWSPSSVKWDLMDTLAQARHLQAGIAYWTVSHTLLGADVARALAADEGFVCVDLHAPTDVDALAALAAEGAHVRVYHEEIRTVGASGRKEPPQLLHAKMLLFGMDDGTLELWVGSHNWTHRGLLGLNVEASLRARLRGSAPLGRGATGYLAELKRISEPFDLTKVDLYKAVQGRAGKGLCPVITLEADEAAGFAGMTVALFGTDTTELTPLDTMRQVQVSLVDRASRAEHVYSAVILHSGLLARSDSAAGGLAFSPRRYAFQCGQGVAAIGPAQPIAEAVLESARYFATLRLGDLQPRVTAAGRPEVEMEVVAGDQSPLIARLDEDALRCLFKGREPRVRRACSPRCAAVASRVAEG